MKIDYRLKSLGYTEIAESEHTYRTLLDLSSEAIVQTDELGIIRVWNLAANSMFGISKSKAVGKYIWDIQYQLVPRERKSEVVRQRIVDVVAQILTVGKIVEQSTYPKEINIMRADGTRLVVENTLCISSTPKGFYLSSITKDITKHRQYLSSVHEQMLQGWCTALRIKEKSLESHSKNVVALTVALSRKYSELSGYVFDETLLEQGALLHDIGKIGISDNILLKPAELSKEEAVIMRNHPVYAKEMLAEIGFLQDSLEIPYCHHEKWDGTGYPRGLSKEAIPISARIFSVIDVFDALTSSRPYREVPFTKEAAIDYIQVHAGIFFDPTVVECFVKMLLLT